MAEREYGDALLNDPGALRKDPNHAARCAAVNGVIAYLLWGLCPLYFKTVAHVAPLEVLAHRIVWACALLAAIVPLMGRLSNVAGEFRWAKSTLLLALSAIERSASAQHESSCLSTSWTHGRKGKSFFV